MDPATAGKSNNYHVDWISTKRVNRKLVQVLNPLPLSVTYSAATDSVSLLLKGTQAFADGGQITVVGTPPGGVSSALGVLLDGNDKGAAGVNRCSRYCQKRAVSNPRNEGWLGTAQRKRRRDGLPFVRRRPRFVSSPRTVWRRATTTITNG
jgi:hypothetical protein